MPKFYVQQLVDAYQYYGATIEADNAEEAMDIARDQAERGIDHGIKWTDEGVNTFDQRDYVVSDEDGEEELLKHHLTKQENQ